jgi:hypothetical protein
MKKIVEKIYWALAFLSIIVLWGSYYWELRYLLEADNPGRNELIEGSGLVLVYSWPIWVGLPMLALIKYETFSKTKIALSFLPIVLVFAPTLFRELSNAL